MMNNSPQSNMKLLVTIVDRGKGEGIATICNECDLYFNFLCLGQGTATSEILDLLGLGTTDKDVVISLLPGSQVKPMLEAVGERMKLKHPGKGIAFSIPITGINRFVGHVLQQHEEDAPAIKEEKALEHTTKHRLIVTVLNAGYTDQVMEAARAAGATGGTVLHARGLSSEAAENFLGIPLQAEKEVLAILVPKENAPAIMEAINGTSGLKTEARAIVLSLPVSELAGLG